MKNSEMGHMMYTESIRGYLYDLTGGRWTELLTVPDLDRLYSIKLTTKGTGPSEAPQKGGAYEQQFFSELHDDQSVQDKPKKP